MNSRYALELYDHSVTLEVKSNMDMEHFGKFLENFIRSCLALFAAEYES